MRFILIFTMFIMMCQSNAQIDYESHSVTRIHETIHLDANWNKPVWQNIGAISLKNYMGEEPGHFPDVRTKIAYDHENVYLIWQVNDQYVRAVAENHQDPVYKDSCVEFFFSTINSVDHGYFNLEVNCGGTMLFKQRAGIDQEFVTISNEDLEQIKVAHSMPRLIPEEIQHKVTWYLEYAIPFDVLKKYYQVDTPVNGTVWRANFYKIADDTSHPHWLTWSKVDYPTPRFHMPEFFGTLVFE